MVVGTDKTGICQKTSKIRNRYTLYGVSGEL